MEGSGGVDSSYSGFNFLFHIKNFNINMETEVSLLGLGVGCDVSGFSDHFLSFHLYMGPTDMRHL